MTSGSAELRELYLDPIDAGVPWLLKPDHAIVTESLRGSSGRAADDECDPDALAADLPDLLVLLRERHFGLATGSIADDGLGAWARAWRERLGADRPVTWGTALGLDPHRLRLLLGDGHVHLAGEDAALTEQLDPRRHQPTLDDRDGPPIEETVVNGVLCLRLRRFWERQGELGALRAWQAAHERHFTYDRIIVDLRGNPGGSDTYSWEWIADHLPQATECYPPSRKWHLDGKPLGAWNQIVRVETLRGPQAVNPDLRALQPHPIPTSRVAIEIDTGSLPAGTSPWRGRMLVLTDQWTASAGESTAWMCRRAFGATLVGSATYGSLTFGDLAPYVMPRSGMEVQLATMRFDVPSMELSGIPVDLEHDTRTPLATFAKEFDHLAG